MFPIYRIVLGSVLAATLFANMLGLAVAAGTNSAAPLADTILEMFGSILQAIGMLTLIFVALERLGIGVEAKKPAAAGAGLQDHGSYHLRRQPVGSRRHQAPQD